MKKTLIAVACAAFISTGAMAKPMPQHTHGTHPSHSVHMVSRGAPHHHGPSHHVHHHAPTPVIVHHSHHDDGAILLSSAIVAFAILASNAM